MNTLDIISYHHMMNDCWRNITDQKLEPQNQPFPVCEARRDGILRSHLEILAIFHLVFPFSIFNWLAEEINFHTPLIEKTKFGISGRLLKTFCGMILWNCIEPSSSLEFYLKKSERPGLTRYFWERIVSFFEYNEGFFFASIHNIFKEQISLGGNGCIDETMWKWTGQDSRIVFIERKPKSMGWKVITMAVAFSKVNLPYLYFMPDVGTSALNVSTVLDTIKKILPVKIPLTMDAWFGSPDWMQSNKDISITCCVSQQRLSHVWNVLSHNLKCGQYRIFTNGSIIVSVFADEKIMKTATTFFRIRNNQQSSSNDNNSNEIILDNKQSIDYIQPPRLSASSIPILQQHSLEDLKALASCLGENTGM